MADGSDSSLMDIEIGDSVFELIEFTLARQLPDGRIVEGLYGVNVAKVREVIRLPKINPLGSSVASIPGIFELRGVPIPAVNVCKVLGDSQSEPKPTDQVIVVEFSNKRAGFIVSNTRRIRRVRWEQVMPPSADHKSCMSGMVLIEENDFLFILDMERIIADLEGTNGTSTPSVFTGNTSIPGEPPALEISAAPVVSPGKNGRLLLVDDSQLILDGVRPALEKQGYSVSVAHNGLEALEVLENSALDDHGFNLIITDLEMPKMDGVTFTKKVREHPIFSDLPVLFHSSLSGDASMKKGVIHSMFS